MTQPLKKAGFAQGIYEQSSSAKEMLGTLRITKDGRKFRYAKAGSSDLCPGKMGLCAALDSQLVDEAGIAMAVGDYSVAQVVTSGVAMAENELRGGYFQVQSAPGPGQNYLITGNTLIDASGTIVNVSLDDPIRVAITTSSKVSLVRSPWYEVYESSTGEAMAAGVAPIVVTTLYYYWAQTGGMANVLQEGTDNMGCNMTVSTSTEGAVVSVVNGTIDADLPLIGINYGIQGETGDYTPVFLTID